MEIYPAVDIKDDKCVNLIRGDFNEATVFDDSPVDAALRWAEAGAGWIHVVDLDGARAGHPVNLNILAEIASATGCRIQAGGGLRGIDDVHSVFAAGAVRAVLGTAAIEDYNKAIQIDTSDWSAYYNRGLARARDREYAKALEDYSAAIRLNPNHAESYANRSSIRDYQGDRKGAIEDLVKALKVAVPAWPYRKIMEKKLRLLKSDQ